MKYISRVAVLVFGLWPLAYGLAAADTIQTTDGKEMKGIVVEDYNDRLVFSTPDGEIPVLKSDIRELSYDTEEENLVKLGEQAKDRGDYAKAFAYYSMASKINPNSKTIKDGLIFLQGYLFRKEEVLKQNDIDKREAFERYGTVVPTTKSDEEELKEAVSRLKDTLGIDLALKDNMPVVANIDRGSPAYEAGIRSGDLLVSVWGKLTGYMPLKDIMALLLDKPALEIKLGIERTLAADISGASFSMEFDGLTVTNVKEGSPAFESGLRKGDLVISIDGKSIRYTPLKKAIALMKSSKDNLTKLAVRRETLIWRRS